MKTMIHIHQGSRLPVVLPCASLPHPKKALQLCRNAKDTAAAAAAVPVADNAAHILVQRRTLLAVVGLLPALAYHQQPAQGLPLAPLGETVHVGNDKLTGLSTEQVKDILARDLSEGMYFVTGRLTKEIFADDCSFVEPTNSVTGLSKYLRALDILFDPEWSKVELLGIRVTGPRTIEADYRSGGWLRTRYFPWQPKVDPYTGHITYTLDSQGLVVRQEQTWSISPAQALAETFSPTLGPKWHLF